jgi:[protein-PII] uridylyltransferase
MEQRLQIARRSDLSGSERRALLTSATDEWLRGVFNEAVAGQAANPTDFCLAAVGGYGRGELSLRSDLDVVLLHEPGARRVEEVASAIWYPIWDSGMSLDHAVRSVPQARHLAHDDFKVMLGLMDARSVAGNTGLAESLRAGVLGDWRAGVAARLSDLHEAVLERRKRVGDLAQLLEPELKEAYGGLRDGVVLRALSASWVVDVPRTSWPASASLLLDVRDVLHMRGMRDRLTMQEQDEIALLMQPSIPGIQDADDLLRAVYLAGRNIAFTSDVAWYRALRTMRPPTSRAPRLVRRLGRRTSASQPERTPLAEGVVVSDGEVLLARGAAVDDDPGLALRAAAAAAQATVILAPATIERLASVPTTDEPWTSEMRESFVSLLGAGSANLTIFEALDHSGILEAWIPEWSTVRSLPQRNPIHEYTVDRHLLQTAVHASSRARDVDRPDLLLVAALLHDIGKGYPGDHSIVGAPIARDIAVRMGFNADDAAMVEQLVLHHLLLPDVATRRDLEDPATLEAVTTRIRDTRTLELLHALTWADAEATGPSVRTEWRRRLISQLVGRCAAILRGHEAPRLEESPALQAALEQSGDTSVSVTPVDDGCSIVVATHDRFGLLSTVAGVLSTHRLHIRGARIRTQGSRAAQEWFVRPLFGEPPDERAIASDLRAALAGDLDIDGRLARRMSSDQPGAAAPAKVIVDRSPRTHTVVEVRAHDEPALLYRITRALVAADTVVTGAKIDTLGSEVVDAFFITDRLGGPLGADHADAVRTTVQAALEAR